MNPAEWSVRHPLPAWSVAVLMFAGGIAACFQLPRFEDPEFTIKQAQVITRYPGASPEEVSREVTDCVENAIQEMGQLKQLDSRSLRGLSIVTAEMRNTCRKRDLPQIWDELRNKIDTTARSLPQGAQVPEVVDDYGDVYGAFFAVTGQGADSVRLHEFARSLQKKLLRAEDVKR
ncbi:MAG: efflux RND transporter permease subunit, partial [Lentisphaeria bacterium]|nr:efflux RND transporter permease subunit [Lentisphaeria bacterium]